MDATLTISYEDYDLEELQDLTYELCQVLNQETEGLKATLPEESGGQGSKGDPITIGTIILTLIGSGGVVVTLVNVLKAYVQRGSNFKIKVKNEKGEVVELTGANLGQREIDQTVKLLEKVIGKGE